MPTSHTDLRILKLHRRGLTPEQIARKIGRPGETGIQRVFEGLKRLRISGQKEIR